MNSRTQFRVMQGAGVVLAALALSGCKVGPDYVAPPPAAPDGWSEAMEEGVRAEGADLSRWWTAFNDQALDSLIDRAVQSNLDLREASARVREARALRGVAESGFYPTVDARGSYTRERFSENSTGARGGFGSATGEGMDLFALGFDAAWEIDVFGRVAREVEASDAELASTVEDWRDVLVSLLAEVARNYTETRSLQDRLRIAESNVKAQDDTLTLVKSRFDAGLTSELDVAQAKANLEQTRSQIPLLTAQLRQSMHRLEILLAQPPGTLQDELTSGEGAIPVPPDSLAVGLPSDLLRRRPDIRRAERDIAAETARIGVATSDLFPRFIITGSAGPESSQIGTLFAGDSFAWSIGPSVRWNIFSGGRIKNNIKAQTARQEQALARYEKTVLTAFHDVEDSLVGYTRERVRMRTLTEAVTAQQRAVSLAEELYTRGLTDFQNVLDAQRQLYSLQDLQAESQRDVTANLIALYKALGGGWENTPVDQQTAAAATTAAGAAATN
jgi:NodT family efflux transporter outer membrane factor (OMF) lipoprotein